VTDGSGGEEPQPCDLCGLPIEQTPRVLTTPEREYAFCCEGCLGIFQMLHDFDGENGFASGERRQRTPLAPPCEYIQPTGS
jgi:hypothetical protein